MNSLLTKYCLKSPVACGLALIFSSSLLVGCNSPTPTDTGTTPDGNAPAASGEGLKLGALLPVTGDLSSIGANMPEAVQLAIDEINACDGVNGAPVTLVSEDSQTDPSAAGAAMTKLAEVDRVAGVVGAFGSSVSGAAVGIAAQNQVMLISPGSTSPVFTEQAKNGDFNGYWARTAPPDTYQAQALAALAEKQGFTNVSTVVINNDYGVGFEEEFAGAFEKSGNKLINKEKPVRYDPKAATLDSEAAAAFANEPDAVAAVLYAETGSILLQAAYKQGLSNGVTVLLTDGVYSQDFVDVTLACADGSTIDAHKVILSSVSTYFREILKVEQLSIETSRLISDV